MTDQTSPETESLIENLLQACVDYETCGPNSNKQRRLDLEKAKQAVRDAIGHAKCSREGLAADLMAFHDACSMDAAGGDGQFRILCSSGSAEQALALRAVLREAAAALSDTSTDRPPIRELSVGATTDKPASDRLASLPSGESDPSVMLGSTEAGTPSDSSTGRKAPASCPHCFDETDCSNVEICNAIEPVTSPVGWGGHLPGKIEP